MSSSRSEFRINGVPSVSFLKSERVLGDSSSHTVRTFSVIKTLGRGQNGSVALCDWTSPQTLPPDSALPVMQTGRGARAEWRSRRLVALKKLNQQFVGGWDECQGLQELQTHRDLPSHPNIIELYDFFLNPDTKTLHLVLEPMEGNLHQLLKSRKGRPLADGLTCSIFSQILAGLGHMHSLDIFHRDLVPENILASTTGLFAYRPVVTDSHPASKEKDIVAVIKLSDFGLACAAHTPHPHDIGEGGGVKWYRAPEILLRAPYYGLPVDMWSLGAIVAELITLAPLFPGTDQIEQMLALLGDPSDEYGCDSYGDPMGGGPWREGLALCRTWGVKLPRVRPKDLHLYFAGKRSPPSLIQCIGQLLRYDPEERLSAVECMNHLYFRQAMPLNNIPDLCAPHLFTDT